MGIFDFLTDPSKVQTTSSTSTDLPDWFEQYIQNLASVGGQLASQPYPTYPGPRLAPFNPAQQRAFDLTQQGVGAWQPGIDQAVNTTAQATNLGPLSTADLFAGASRTFPGAVSEYLNPYSENVINRASELAGRSFREQIAPEIENRFIGAGQFGSAGMRQTMDRAARDLTEGLQSQAAAQLAQGYDTAGRMFGEDTSRLAGLASSAGQLGLQGGQQLGTLSELAQRLRAGDAAGLQAIGAQQQGQNQASLDLGYEDFQRQRDYPWQQLDRLSGLIRGIPTQQTTTTNTSEPGPSNLQQGLSLLSGIYGLGKEFDWWGKARGGAVRSYQEGGAVDEFADDEFVYPDGDVGALSALEEEEPKAVTPTDFASQVLTGYPAEMEKIEAQQSALEKQVAERTESARKVLQEARAGVLARRNAASNPWLAVSGALGAPTKTGLLSEAMGNVSRAIGENSAQREGFEQQRQRELLGIDSQLSEVDKQALEQQRRLLEMRRRQQQELAVRAMAAKRGPAAGGGIGNYNPGDFTPESWAKFFASGYTDPSVLVRYAAPQIALIGKVPTMVGRTGAGGDTSALSTLEREAEGAATVAGAEAGAKARAQSAAEIQNAIQKKGADARSVLGALDLAEPLIDVATGSMTGNAADKIAGAFGKSLSGAEAIAQLKIIQVGLMMNMPRMEGPQSDRDTKLYAEAAGQIGDPNVPRGVKRAAVTMIRALNEKYAERAADAQNAASPAQGAPPAAAGGGELQYIPGKGLQR
jgi:hypothetical protein